MSREGDMDYAATRVQSRHGQRLDEAGWRRLEASRSLPQYLDAIRATPLAGWTASLVTDCDCHAIERTLRLEWRRYVENVSSWHPHAAQPWLAWCAWLPMLSLVARLARAEAAPEWLLADPVCGPFAPGNPADRAAALTGTPLAPLMPALLERIAVGPLWWAHWQHLTPLVDPQTRDLLDRLMHALETHAKELTKATETPATRRALAAHLTRLFRAGAGTLVATACHLALMAMDLERLRGGLVTRCALPDTAVAA